MTRDQLLAGLQSAADHFRTFAEVAITPTAPGFEEQSKVLNQIFRQSALDRAAAIEEAIRVLKGEDDG